VDNLTKEELGRALHAYNVGLPYIRAGYWDCIHLLELQLSLLSHHVPYSIQAEIEINTKLMNYINLCVRYINVFKTFKVIEWLDFPIEHELLRRFRDYNHHNADHVFRPITSRHGTEFYIWPNLFQIPAIAERYPEWCRRGTYAVLSDLLARNQKYVETIFDSARQAMGGDAVMAKYIGEYHLGHIHLGDGVASVEESWNLNG
jgi:hypothetical protein